MNIRANKSIVTLRGEASENAEVVDELLYGMKAQIIEETTRKWVRINTFYGYKGYAKRCDLFKYSVEARCSEYRYGYIDSSFADILQEGNIKSQIIFTLVRGSLIKFCVNEELVNGFVKVKQNNGNYGYVKRELIKVISDGLLLDEIQLRENIVKTAMSYLGTQYRWGGKSPLGIDCSGLCQIAYLINGIIIFRDARIVDGFPIHEIPFELIKPADLLYFKGHVAMYIGEKKYIHSTLKSGKVVINSLDKNSSLYREDLANGILYVGTYF